MFWIDASGSPKNSIELGLMQIAQVNNVLYEAKQSTGSVLQWISQGPNWHMMYNSPDGHCQITGKIFPLGNGGNTLITSKNVGLKRISLILQKVLNIMGEEAAFLLLNLAAALDGMSDHNNNWAKKLASEMGGTPLALDQAGTYILSTQCDIAQADYLELYTKSKVEHLSYSESKDTSDYDRTTYGTWDISMQRLDNLAAKDAAREEALTAQSAINILRIFAFLNHANIGQESFKDAVENYMKRDVDEEAKSTLPLSKRLFDYQTLFVNKEGVWDKMKALAGIQVLISFSLVEAHHQQYWMHPLPVHTWNRNKMPKAEITNFYHKARTLLFCSVVLDYSIDNYAFCRLPVVALHVRVNALLASESELKSTYYEDEDEVFTLVFYHIGSWDEREKLEVDVINARKGKLGSDHLNSSMTNLASTYRNLGRWDETEKLLDVMNGGNQVALLIKITKLPLVKGADVNAQVGYHDNALQALISEGHDEFAGHLFDKGAVVNEQGGTCSNALQVVSLTGHAEQITRLLLDKGEAMDIQGGYYGNALQAPISEGHDEIAELLSEKGADMNAQGESCGNAISEGHAEINKLLESNHPDTLISMTDLASLYWQQGPLNGAEKLDAVMNARKANLGSDDLGTLTSMANLATTYINQGRWNEAEKLQVDIVNARKLGSDDLETLTSVANLASTYMNQGRWGEAEKLGRHLLEDGNALYGMNHPYTFAFTCKLAETLLKQKKLDEAEELAVHGLKIAREIFGPNHTDEAHFPMSILGLVYHEQGKLDEAEKLQVSIVETSKQSNMGCGVDSLVSMNNLALTYQKQGRWEDAERLQLQVIEASKSNLGPDHPNTLSKMENLLMMYWQQKKLSQSKSLVIHIMEAKMAKLGLEHPESLWAIFNVGMIYQNLGYTYHAEKVVAHALKGMKKQLGNGHADTQQMIKVRIKLLIQLMMLDMIEIFKTIYQLEALQVFICYYIFTWLFG